MFSTSRLPQRLIDGGVVLRRLDPATDAAELFEALAAPVWEHIPGGAPDDAVGLADRFRSRAARDGRIGWTIQQDGLVVGSSSHIPAGEGVEIGATTSRRSGGGRVSIAGSRR